MLDVEEKIVVWRHTAVPNRMWSVRAPQRSTWCLTQCLTRLSARVSTIALALFIVTGCGGSGGSTDPAPSPPLPPPSPISISKAEAFRFLNQATFGATEAEAQRLQTMGYEAWLDDQLTQPASLQLPYLQALPRSQFLFEMQPDRVDIWFRNALFGEDQLRQRVAFALSEILVVSQRSVLNNATYSLGDYYDLLAVHAFGNYRDLIETVTLHPAMGVYLSMLGNRKPDPTLNIRPDENYARELMQLFSIGLVHLDIDGSVMLDGDGQAIPTYDQSVIEGFAHVFTGWTYAGAPSFEYAFQTDLNQVVPMQLFPDFHDDGSKRLLNDVVIPAGQSGMQDLSDALDNIFDHPNVGPFLARRLIQRLVASNPSGDYVSRVAEVFNDNGFGVRGDLGAVVKAILMDPEARSELPTDVDGKLKEPIIRLTQLWRAYNARSASGRYPLFAVYIYLGQGPLQSPSVFNFFSPDYAPPGEIRSRDLVSPELEIATEFQNTSVTNHMFYQVFIQNWTADIGDPDLNLDANSVLINFAEETEVAADVERLIDMVAGKLLGDEISAALRAEIVSVVSQIPEQDRLVRAAETLYLVLTSPEYAYQR